MLLRTCCPEGIAFGWPFGLLYRRVLWKKTMSNVPAYVYINLCQHGYNC